MATVREDDLRSGGWAVIGLRCLGSESAHFTGRVFGKFGQGAERLFARVLAQVDLQRTAGLLEEEDRGCPGSGLFAGDVQPVLAGQRHRANRVFAEVLSDLDGSVFGNRSRLIPPTARRCRRASRVASPAFSPLRRSW